MGERDVAGLTRRQLLLAGAGLSVAGGAFAAKPGPPRLSLDGVAPPPTDLPISEWAFELWHQAPELAGWRVLDSHDTGYVTPNWQPKTNDMASRISFVPPNDGRVSYRHRVDKNQIVDPVGMDSRRIDANFSTFSRVLLRYHHWVGDYSGLPGKWIGLQLGRGWVGRNYVKKIEDGYGSDGASGTTMHPERDGKNGIRLLATHKNQSSPYGQNIGDGKKIIPKGRWLTIDVVVDRDTGYRLYVDGEQQAKSGTIKPMRNWNSCSAIWYRNRLMHGGTPSELPSIRNYREWFGGFYVAVA